VNLTNRVAESRKQNRNLYLCEIEFVEDILGAQPKTEKLLRGWLEAKLNREAREAARKGQTPPSEERLEELIQSHLERLFSKPMDETIEEEEEYAHTTFFFDEIGPYLGDYAVNACFREMLVCLGITSSPKKRGSKQTFQHLMLARACHPDGTLVEGDKTSHLHFYRDGQCLKEVDGFMEMTGNVSNAQGKMSIIKRHDFIEGARLRFVIDIQANLESSRSKTVLGDEEVIAVLSAAQTNGLGACRGMSHGRFKLVHLERLTNNPYIKGTKPPGMGEKEEKSKKAKPSNGAGKPIATKTVIRRVAR